MKHRFFCYFTASVVLYRHQCLFLSLFYHCLSHQLILFKFRFLPFLLIFLLLIMFRMCNRNHTNNSTQKMRLNCRNFDDENENHCIRKTTTNHNQKQRTKCVCVCVCISIKFLCVEIALNHDAKEENVSGLWSSYSWLCCCISEYV